MKIPFLAEDQQTIYLNHYKRTQRVVKHGVHQRLKCCWCVKCFHWHDKIPELATFYAGCGILNIFQFHHNLMKTSFQVNLWKQPYSSKMIKHLICLWSWSVFPFSDFLEGFVVHETPQLSFPFTTNDEHHKEIYSFWSSFSSARLHILFCCLLLWRWQLV